MGLLQKFRWLLGLIEGHEDEVAKQVSKRTSLSEQTVKDGLSQAQEFVSENSADGVNEQTRS
ncbi:MAG: hypothetical protein ABEH81_15715 [Halopenitus sp.]